MADFFFVSSWVFYFTFFLFFRLSSFRRFSDVDDLGNLQSFCFAVYCSEGVREGGSGE